MRGTWREAALAAAFVAAVGWAGGAGAASLAATYSSFWALGDSHSDNGNLFAATSNATPPNPTPASPPYFDGRFSNGPV